RSGFLVAASAGVVPHLSSAAKVAAWRKGPYDFRSGDGKEKSWIKKPSGRNRREQLKNTSVLLPFHWNELSSVGFFPV
ncbi:MAG: hypothetical protein WBC81_07120, partial [Chitinophagaceae bacterium]